jgi:hypothetical protein
MPTTITIEMLAQRIETLEKQMATLTAPSEPAKKPKKSKKSSDSDSEDKPKVKRVSGYILYSNANRAEVKADLSAKNEDATGKFINNEVMKELGRLWKELPTDEQDEWNSKAKEIKDAM